MSNEESKPSCSKMEFDKEKLAVPDESNVTMEEYKADLKRLKEIKEKRWAVIKQKFFEKYQDCSEEEEEDRLEKYLEVEEYLPPEKVKTDTDLSSKGAWFEQEFIAAELKPYHEEAERLRTNIEEKIKVLNLIENPKKDLSVEIKKENSSTCEPTTVTGSNSITKVPEIKGKMRKKPVARKSKDGSGSSGANRGLPKGKKLKSSSSDDSNPSSVSGVKKNTRMVLDEELEEALNKLHENKLRRWALIKQKFCEKYENIDEKASNKLGYRNFELLGQEGNLVFNAEDLAPQHQEARYLKDYIEAKILTLKPFQAKLKKKKEAQQNKECSKKTMEKFVKATLQFQKKCTINGELLVVQERSAKSTPSSVGADEQIFGEKIPAPFTHPKANDSSEITPCSLMSKPKRKQKAPKKQSVQTATNAAKSPSVEKSVQNTVSSCVNKKDATDSLLSDSSVSVQTQHSAKQSENPTVKNQTVLKFQERMSLRNSNPNESTEEMDELDSESVIPPSPNPLRFSCTIKSPKNQTMQRIEECRSVLAALQVNCPSESKNVSKSDVSRNVEFSTPVKHQSLRATPSPAKKKLSSDKPLKNSPMNIASPRSSPRIHQLSKISPKNRVSPRKKYPMTLDGSAFENEILESDKRTNCVVYRGSSPRKPQSSKISPKNKASPSNRMEELLPGPSTSGNMYDMSQITPKRVIINASNFLSEYDSSPVNSNTKPRTSTLKKQHYMHGREQSATYYSDLLLDSAPVGPNFKASSAPSEEQTLSEPRKRGRPYKKPKLSNQSPEPETSIGFRSNSLPSLNHILTEPRKRGRPGLKKLKLSNPSLNFSLQNLEPNRSFEVKFSSFREESICVLTNPPIMRHISNASTSLDQTPPWNRSSHAKTITIESPISHEGFKIDDITLLSTPVLKGISRNNQSPSKCKGNKIDALVRPPTENML